MEGIHDLGGMHGFGAIEPTPEEPPFHQPWEGRAHGVRVAAAIAVSGTLRPHIERMGNSAYLTATYYERWLHGLEARLVEAEVLSWEELEQRRAQVAAGEGSIAPRRDPDAAAFVRSLFRPFDVTDPEHPAPRFARGDRVRVKHMHPGGHTRCPRYVRGATGTVALLHGAQPLPDRLVEGETLLEPYYSVAFSPVALWGDDAEPGTATIHVDLWESYLDGAEP